MQRFLDAQQYLVAMFLFAASVVAGVGGCAAHSLGEARAQNTVQAYQRFLNEYPSTPPYTAEADDHLHFLLAKEDGSLDAFGKYVAEYPAGIHRLEAKAHIWYLQIIGDSAPPLVRLVLLKEAEADFEKTGSQPMPDTLRYFLHNIYFAKYKVSLVAERQVDSSHLGIFGFTLHDSWTSDVFAGVVFPGEAIFRCNGGSTLRTLHSFGEDHLRHLAEGKTEKPICREEAMIETLAGDEAFGRVDGEARFSELFTSEVPSELASSVVFSQKVGQRTESSGALHDVLRGAASFAVEHPVATQILFESLKRRHERAGGGE